VTPRDAAEHPTSAASSRRRLLGLAAGGTALALVADQVRGGVASASVPPQQPTAGDTELLVFAQGLELAIRDLYDAALEAGAPADLFGVIRENHEAYGQGIAGLTGNSASERNEELYSSLESDFASSDATAVAQAAYDLESVAVATHTELLGLLESSSASKLVAAVIAIESRHCTVLADASGNGDDLGALLDNDAQPVLPASAS
jgi:hypothetical protein